MAEPFLSELRLMSFFPPPKGWVECNGQLMPIAQNQALFSLLGTTYGGDGRVTFGLPNLQGRVPMHQGMGHTIGERSGVESVTLGISQIPTHVHIATGSSTDSDSRLPADTALLGQAANQYGVPAADTALTSLHPSTVTAVGGSQAHTNMQPFLTLSWCIATQGIFPSQN